jgi:hypothetical protein
MKMKISNIIALGLIIALVSFKSGDGPKKFVQFYIPELENSEKAKLINDFINSKPGIQMSRTDVVSHSYYAILNPGVTYTEEDFKAWVLEKGYSISCFYSGTVGVDSFRKISIDDCNELNKDKK